MSVLGAYKKMKKRVKKRATHFDDVELTQEFIDSHPRYNFMGSPNQTVREARSELWDSLENGELQTCSQCGQTCKVYPIKLNSYMAHALCWTVKYYSGDWIHIPKVAPKWLVAGGGAYAKLERWGLIESKPNTEKAKRTSGYWRPTELGKAFALGEMTVAKRVFIYNSMTYGFSTEQTDIRTASEDKFDYDELMNG